MQIKELVLNNWPAKFIAFIVAFFIWLLVKAHISDRGTPFRPEQFPPNSSLSQTTPLPVDKKND